MKTKFSDGVVVVAVNMVTMFVILRAVAESINIDDNFYRPCDFAQGDG